MATKDQVEEKVAAQAEEIATQANLIAKLQSQLNEANEDTTSKKDEIEGLILQSASALEDQSRLAAEEASRIARMTPTVTLPDKIAAWMREAHGIDIKPEQVMKTDILPHSVRFQLKHLPTGITLDEVYQIQTLVMDSDELVKPPTHIHEMKARRHGDALKCRCGKSPDDLSEAEKELADMGDPSEAQKASRKAIEAKFS